MRLLAICVALLMGCGDSDAELDAASGPDAAWSRMVSLPPGQFIEANMIMEQGGSAGADFTATAALEWNIHEHDPDDPGMFTNLETGDSAAEVLSFTAPNDGPFSFMWSNTSLAAVDVSIELSFDGEAHLHSWD